jgi:hypothetical protein
MVSRELEFRGINRRELELYFVELGGKRLGTAGEFPIVFQADGWEGRILSEEEIAFTAVFKVNAVKVRFSAADEPGLEELIKNYRYKTTRVGG